MATYIAEDYNDSIVPFYQESDNYKPITRGSGSISGQVLEQGLPVARRVMLFERSNGYLVQQTMSASDGKYSFSGTNPSAVYFIVSLDEYDDATQYNLVGQDLITGDYDAKAAAGAW